MLATEGTAQNRFLLIYVLWWVAWYFIADNLRVVHISSEATVAVFTSIAATAGGALLARLRWHVASAHRPTSTIVDEPWIKQSLRAYIFIQLLVLILALRGMATYGSSYRTMYFKDPGLIFGHPYIQMIYDNGLGTLASYLLMRWLTNGGDLKSWYGYIAVTGLLSAAIVNGRFGVYNALFLIGMALALGHRVSKTVWLGVLGSIPLAFAILYFRTQVTLEEVNQGLVTSDFRETVLKYHVLGFYLFDYHITHHTITTAFPLCNSLGILGLPLYGFIKYVLGSDTAPYCYGNLLIALDKNVDIDDFGYTNAFGTNLLPFYVDGGLALVAIAFALAGYTLFQPGRRGNVNPIAVQILYILVFGLFQPILNSAALVIPLLFHWVTYRRESVDSAPLNLT